MVAVAVGVISFLKLLFSPPLLTEEMVVEKVILFVRYSILLLIFCKISQNVNEKGFLGL